MRGLLEFAMEELISNQLLIGETFDKMHDLIEKNFAELDVLKEIYTHKSVSALFMLWNNFEDNNCLLIEAQVKEDNYYTSHYFDKVKEEYDSMFTLLYRATHPELEEDYFFQEANPVERTVDMSRLQRDMLINHQGLRFNIIEAEIKNINIDRVREIIAMEYWQKILKTQWKAIEKCHKVIREKYSEMWPDLTYELDYVRHKNMYETTYSLFNYKIDATLYPVVRVIPHIGIPTWRMFAHRSKFVDSFVVNSVAWRNFDFMHNVISNNKISEGEKRQIMITTFLTYQNDELLTPKESDSELEDNLEFHNACDEPLLLPLVDEID